MNTYLILTGIVIFVITALNFLPPGSRKIRIKKKPGFLDAYVAAMAELKKGGTELDTIPEGYGEFGLVLTNPIPVNSVFGNTVYLGRLRTLEGKKIKYERLGSTGAQNIEHPIDIYAITLEGIKIANLFISPYHKKISKRAPQGFIIIQE